MNFEKNAYNSDNNFIINYKEELNESQYDSVITEGPELVIAGAGSGKTRTIVYKVAYLIEKGVLPQSILLLTFTRKAAFEMTRRAGAILDDRCSRVVGGTFHSFGATILRRYAEQIGYSSNFTILDNQDAEDIISLLKNQMGFNKKEERFPRKDTLQGIISKSINTGETIEKILESDYPHFFEHCESINILKEKYAVYKKQKNIMDYDDLLVKLKDLLSIDEMRIKLSNRYRYIMIDEYQDTNRIQAQIACYLASEHGNIMIVGDDSQSIYSFRGANFKNIMQFPEIFPDAKIIKLEQNYRSTQPILNFTNAVIENAKEKYSKKLYSFIEGDVKPVFVRSKDSIDQAKFIVKTILELRDKGIKLNDIAVLFRSSFHSNELEIELNSRNIPYIKYGGLKFIETAHIKDIISFLRISKNQNDELSYHRVLTMIDGIGDKTSDNIVFTIIQSSLGLDGVNLDNFKNKNYYAELKSLFLTLKKISDETVSVSERIKFIMKFYTRILKEKYDNYHKRINDIETLIKISEKYENVETFLTDMALEPPTETQHKVIESTKEDEFLTISTIHSAKGLEWNSVFVIQLINGLFPSSKSIENQSALEEERRLFYVATTRAKKNLYLCAPNFVNIDFSSFYSQEKFYFSDVSCFIKEIENFKELTVEATFEKEEESSDSNDNFSRKSSGQFNRIKSFFEER